MSTKNLFNEPFDEGTKIKLLIFKEYLQEWLPVFFAKKHVIWNRIQIFDFFSGPGKDIEGTSGSPLITLEEVNKNIEYITKQNLSVRLLFNDIDADYYQTLKSLVEQNSKPEYYSTIVENKDFNTLFDMYYSNMEESANLIFIDQGGVKQVTEEVFSKLISLKQTDLLFFISSSFLQRFGDSEEFKKYLRINKAEIEGRSYYHIHRLVLEYYRKLIPSSKKYYLAPFSIKKKSNVYGLIFGTNHTLGLEKFLSVCWRLDKQRGEANFDIDQENINQSTPSLFKELNVPNKRQIFEVELKDQILKGKLRSDNDVYLFALQNGFLLKDANKILNQLKDERRIQFGFETITRDLHKRVMAQSIRVME